MDDDPESTSWQVCMYGVFEFYLHKPVCVLILGKRCSIYSSPFSAAVF